jgi:7-cyano-7-deazaguanine synthase
MCRRVTHFQALRSPGRALAATDIFIGVNLISQVIGLPPEYIAAYEHSLATRRVWRASALKIHTPLIALGKAQIIHLGIALGVDYALTSSCYDPQPDGALRSV